MSRTLFWYMFWNLLRVFLLTTLNLAGMMTFAGLLRPLTQNGLDIGQVNKLLLYMTPAMSTYSLPVAALFAATMVYGRFSADNELTAMRASGIGYLSCRRFSIALPALVLGLLVATISLLLLCFVVPIFSLKVEQVVRLNIAKVIVSKIEREHLVTFPGTDDTNIYAEAARLLPTDPAHPEIQQVELLAAAMMDYEKIDGVRVPRTFWMAKSAILTITRGGAGGGAGEDDKASASDSTILTAKLNGGIKFPRQFYGNVYAGVAETTYGPEELPSPLRENVKFMDVGQLTRQAGDPGRGQRVKNVIAGMVRTEQKRTFLGLIANEINSPAGNNSYRFEKETESGDSFWLGGTRATAELRDEELIITAPSTADDARPVWMKQWHGSQETLEANAKEIHVRASPDPINHFMGVSVELYNVSLHTPNNPNDNLSERSSFMRGFTVAMPPRIVAIGQKSLADYKTDSHLNVREASLLRHEELVVNNAARSELHGRASFALSCLTLVMVGCALGMMFKSGNFLNAFAISFVPALLCITLIFCGQSAATHVPIDIGPVYHDPLKTGLAFIWVGNVLVLIGAVYLTAKLQRR